MSKCKFIRTSVFGMTQTEFAALLGVRQTAVSELEKRDAFPAKHQRTVRRVARERGIEWRDEWFFETPTEAAQ